jgi:hypothetical protein
MYRTKSSVQNPPHPSDLTPLEFNLWGGGSLKEVVCRRKPPTLETLWEETEKSCAIIPLDTLATVSRAILLRTEKCL